MSPVHPTWRQLLTAVIVIVLTLQACVLPASAQSDPVGILPVAPASADSPDANYSLSGRVTTSGGAPIAGVTVTATPPVDVKYPIVLLPGVMGTLLGNNPLTNEGCAGVTRPSGTVWLKKDSGQWQIDLDALVLSVSGDRPKNSCDQISPIGPMALEAFVGQKKVAEVNPYSRFVEAAGSAGYPVLPYNGYDWRLTLTDAVAKLDTFIDDNAGQSGKVYLVAHSMGGLLARAYVADATRANKIAGVVTVGTPYLGAPMMTQIIATARPGLPIDLLLKADQIKEFARTSPGIQQLLPSPAYVDSTLGKYYLPKTGALLDTYRKIADYFVEQNYLARGTLAIAESFHAELDGFDRNFFAQGRYTVLYSSDSATPWRIIERGCGVTATDTCVDVNYTQGDGSVPVGSSSLKFMPATSRAGVTFCEYSAYIQKFKKHMDLFLDQRVIDDILHILNGEPTVHCDTNTSTARAATSLAGFRGYAVWGTGRVQVIDDRGKFTGIDDNGFLVRDLDDVTYLLTEGGVILTMPSDASYRLAIRQTSSQAMQVLVTDYGLNLSNESYSKQAQAVYDTVLATNGGVATVSRAGAGLSQLLLAVDANADGTAEIMLPPDIVLTDPVQVQDTVMPTTTLALQGSQDDGGAYTEFATVSLNAVDDNAGVLKSYYSLDGGQTWQKYTAPVQIQPGQAASVQAYSVDKAGNQEYPPVEKMLRFAGQTNLYLPHVQSGAPRLAVTTEIETERLQVTRFFADAVPLDAPQPEEQPVVQPATALAVYTATTGVDGYYIFTNLPAGSYNITAMKATFVISPANQTAYVPPNRQGADFTASATYADTVEEILIPADSFQMGCVTSSAVAQCYQWELLHTVYLDAYYIDKYEVTNDRYKACVEAGACTPPLNISSLNNPSYYGNSTFGNYPVINVSWYQAASFCQWAGKSLPTEAEWEMAGRSDDLRSYPWGNELPDCTRTNYTWMDGGFWSSCKWDTAASGEFTNDISPFGVMDMGGNVAEWVADWSSDDYYAVSPPANPTGPTNGTSRVQRGGSYYMTGTGSPRTTLVFSRYRYTPLYAYYDVGFRCARTP